MIRTFVAGCDNFECDRIEKHLTEIDQMKEEKAKIIGEISALNSKIEKEKANAVQESKRLQGDITRLSQMQENLKKSKSMSGKDFKTRSTE